MTTLVTATQIADLRRMVAEPTTTTYSDALLTATIEKYPLLDEQGEAPFTLGTQTITTTVDADSAAAQKVLNVASTVGFRTGKSVRINSGGVRDETKTIDSIVAGVSLTMTTNLIYTHTALQADAVAYNSPLPLIPTENDEWIPTYDLNAAAADIWQEKAATWIALYDFSADGGNYSRMQVYEAMQTQARYYRSRRSASVVRLHQWPEEPASDVYTWVANINDPKE